MTALETETTSAPAVKIPAFLELEITQFCQLKCTHCYSNSGPDAGRGTMTPGDWQRLMDQAAAIGVTTVQFIGGCFRTRRVPWGSCLIGLSSAVGRNLLCGLC